MGKVETDEERAARHAASHARLVTGYQYLMASASPVAIGAAMKESVVGRRSWVEGEGK